MIQKKIIVSVFCVLVSFLGNAQTQNIAVFKNGMAFFSKSQSLKTENGKIVLQNIPQATFGTLWFYTPDNKIKSISSFTKEIQTKKEVETMLDFLKAGKGKAARLTLWNDKVVDGVVETAEDKLITFKTNTGRWMSLAPSSVRLLELLQKPSSTYQEKEDRRIVELELQQNKASQELDMMYLQKGISWVPSYVIELLDDKKARLTLRAALLNDVEDLKDATINFVVGVPNFAYSYLNSPLTSNDKVAGFINTLNNNSNQYPAQRRRADITVQSMSNVMLESSNEELDFQNLQGQSAEDLFFYNAKNITLQKGGRAFYDVLQEEQEYEHIYEVLLKENTSRFSYYDNIGSTEYSEQSLNSVWHSIRLKNTSKLPWTTGTVLVTQKIDGVDKPLSQDKLSYIPAGGRGKVKLTVAPNISVKNSEKQINREKNKKKSGGYNYDRVTIKGKIELKSYQDKAVTLNISRYLTGEAIESSETWEVEKKFNAGSPNPDNKIEWDVNLPAGKSKTVTYEYSVYARR